MRANNKPMTAKLVDSLYVEAMVLADEARSYFDGYGREERDRLSPVDRVRFSCEALNVTTRLMHSVAWLLSQRAINAGELRPDARGARLGAAGHSEEQALSVLPEQARTIAHASEDLYDRIARMDTQMREPRPNAAREMLESLAQAF